MTPQIQKLKNFLERKRKDCFEQEEEETLTREGRGMALIIKAIYEHMNWKPIKLVKRKLCKLTKKENEFWGKIYEKQYAGKEYTEEEARRLTTEATIKRFPRLIGYDKLI
tara:strand:+ start:3739 stop:4068 length:330 start_codon:yes stop_codon:yes gene_type:complete